LHSCITEARKELYMNCTNCNSELSGKYCANCGQAAELKRIDGRYIIHEIEHVLHFERGILYTIKELIISPGQNVKNFLTRNRSRLVKPIIFIIITSLIYTLGVKFLHFEDGYIEYKDDGKHNAVTAIFEWIQGHYGYANIIMGIFIAFWIKLFFRKHNYNFFEILILLCFVMGMAMLIYTIFGIAQSIIHVQLMNFAGMAVLVYLTWSIGSFFGKEKASNYVKALIAYILGMLTSVLVAIAIGVCIEVMKKS
jgi:hypothetical protein